MAVCRAIPEPQPAACSRQLISFRNIADLGSAVNPGSRGIGGEPGGRVVGAVEAEIRAKAACRDLHAYA